MSSSVSSGGDSLLPAFERNREQVGKIIEGLREGHRLAFDKQTGNFVSLDKKSGDPRHLQDLSLLVGKIEQFIEEANGIGVTSEDIRNIHKAVEARSLKLKGRISGLRGLFKSKEQKNILQQQSLNLSSIATRVDKWVVKYLDEYGLLTGTFKDPAIPSHYREWFLNQAVLIEHMEHADPETKKQLGLILLHGYTKAAARNESSVAERGIQASPVLEKELRYHRSVQNTLFTKTNAAFAKEMGVPPSELLLVDSPLFREVLARELSPDMYTVETEKDFEKLIDRLLDNLSKGQQPQKFLAIEITQLLASQGIAPEKINPSLLPKLKKIIEQKVVAFKKTNPGISSKDLKKFYQQIQLIAFTEHKGEHVLLTPKLFPTKDDVKNSLIEDMMRRTGFVLGTDHAKAAWLKISGPLEILSELGIPKTALATRGKTVPKVCRNFSEFLDQPIVNKFLALSLEEEPYLRILPKATIDLLNGLRKLNVDGVYAEKGIGDLLQISYFRMINAMNEAILRRGDLIAFNNHIELIHQEIQSILALVQPYDNEAFSETIRMNLTTGDPPLVGPDLPDPRGYLKPSGMHCTSSALASVEAQKGTNRLNVAVLKDSYYEASHLIEDSSAYSMSTLDGDRVEKEGIRKGFDKAPAEPLDVLLCEFHHNISVDRQVYRPENIAQQVKALFREKMVADRFTVIIDTTINLENAEDVREFLDDPEIKPLIQAGKLNVVLVRSAQKFDMLGIDNYYGGIAVSVNQHEAFAAFNTRMGAEEDQERGLSYQGITHLEKHGSESIEAYRQGVMDNTRKLYEMLPKGAIHSEGSTNPMQISKMEDDKLVFLDIKFPESPNTTQVVFDKLKNYISKNRIFISKRPSFGFSTTNLIIIQKSEDSRLVRLTPGLEGEPYFRKLADFFERVQGAIDKSLKGSEQKSAQRRDLIAASAIHALEF